MELLNTVEQSWNQNRLHVLLIEQGPLWPEETCFQAGVFKFGDPSLFWDIAMLSRAYTLQCKIKQASLTT